MNLASTWAVLDLGVGQDPIVNLEPSLSPTCPPKIEEKKVNILSPIEVDDIFNPGDDAKGLFLAEGAKNKFHQIQAVGVLVFVRWSQTTQTVPKIRQGTLHTLALLLEQPAREFRGGLSDRSWATFLQGHKECQSLGGVDRKGVV